MKKISFLIAFAMIGSSALIAKNTNTTIEEDVFACTNVTLSCGVSGNVCYTDLGMLASHIQFAEKYWCGGTPKQ
ncbi:hypothetical protein [uncultured Dokdonia sp.]|uniref:hypothetical protein n=1 Tax=uncultured Dokdonia sp. TaxID=575653 RepID=UPI00263248B2|nr:hypothetical protein [uncultured Dokdonia sp.]|tara:strand:+ start:16795 stop:17016 length:222 start_codon:yes stop_codon:yes gene_type:complete